MDDDNHNAIVVTQYPVSNEDMDTLREVISDDFSVLSVATLISQGHMELIGYLRSLRYERVVVYLSRRQEIPFADALILVSLLIKSNNRVMFLKDEHLNAISLLNGLASFLRIVFSIGIAMPIILFLWIRCDWLLRKPRTAVRLYSIKKKNVLYIKMTLWLGIQVGGAITHARGIINTFCNNGYRVRVLTSEPIELTLINENVEIINLNPKLSYTSPREINHFLYHFFYFLNYKIKKTRTDNSFIYQRLSAGNFIGVEISRIEKIPLIIEYNGSEIWLSENWGTPYFFKKLISKIEKLTLMHAHLIVCVSEALKQELIDKDIEPDRIIVAPNGFDPLAFSDEAINRSDILNIRSYVSQSKNSIIFTFVGTFGPWHGAEVMAEAIRHFFENIACNSIDNDVRFVFVGDGVKKKIVENLLQRYIADGRVLMTGNKPSDEIPILLAASDVCVLPTKKNSDGSAFFGSPTKLFEYMGAGKPIIASMEGQIGDVLSGAIHVDEFLDKRDLQDKNQVAVSFDSGDHHQLAKGFSLIAKNHDWRVAAGKHARRRALDNYTWAKSLAKITDVVNEIAAKEIQSIEPVNVLINALHSKSGGGVTYLKNILPKLSKREDMVIHVILQKDQILLFEDVLHGTTVHEIKNSQNLWSLLFREQIIVPVIGRKIKADVTFSPANYAPLFSGRSMILIRNALEVGKIERRLLKRLYWILLMIATSTSSLRASRVIGVSNYAISCLPPIIKKLFMRNVAIVPHGVSEDFWYDKSVPKEENQLLFVSDLYVQKNLHSLVAALAIIVKDFDVKLDVIGASLDKDYTQEIMTQVADLKLQGNVNFHGHVASSQLAEYYQRCAVFVFPSTIETFGNPLVEAMSCGAAIACSRSAAMPEVAGDAAAYFDPNDPEEIACVILELLCNSEMRNELRNKACERAKNYSWDGTAMNTAHLLIDTARV